MPPVKLAQSKRRPQCAVPSAPASFKASGGSGQASFSWTAASGNGTSLDAYILRVNAGPDLGQSLSIDPSATSATLTGLAAGTSVTFMLAAHSPCGLGKAATSNAVTVTGPATTYASVVTAAKPDVFYRMADSSLAVMADSSGHGYDGFYQPGNTTLGATGPLAGDSSTAATGDGGSYLSQVNVDKLPTGNSSRTVEMWVQDTADNSGRPLVAWGNTSGSASDQQFTIYENANGITIDAGYDPIFLPCPYPLNDGVWHLITVVYNGTRLTVYVDGLPIGTASFTATLNTTPTGLDTGESYYGTLANLAIYPTALTSATITTHFTASGLSRPGPPQVPHASYGGPTGADLSWGAASAAGTTISGYVVRALNGPSAGQSQMVPGDTTGTRLTGLAAGSYAFRVQAVDSYGLGTAVTTNIITVTGAAATYGSDVLAAKPDVFYRMADSSLATMADSSGNGYDGFYQPGNTTLGATGPLTTDSSTAATGDGGSYLSQVNVDTLPTGNSPRTVEIWAQATADNSGRPLVAWGNTSGSASDQQFVIDENANGITVDAGYDPIFLPSRYPLNDGTWHLITVTYNGTKLAIYIDGTQIGTASFTGTLNTTPTGLDTGQSYYGTLANLAIYPTALTSATITTHFTASGLSRPAAVQHPTATGGTNQATITWTAPTPGTTPILGYRITTQTGGTKPGNTIAVAASDTSAILTGLAAGSDTFKVQAINSYGIGTAATTSSVQITGTASTYAAQVLAAKPDVFYRMADSSLATMADSSGHSYDGFYQPGDTTLGAPGPLASDPATGASNDGGSYLGQVNVDKLPTGNSSRTVEMWVQDTADNSGRPLVAWGNTSGSASDQQFTIYENANGITVDAGYDSQFVASRQSLNDGTWHLVTVVYNGTRLAVYIDGASIGTASFAATLDTTPTGLDTGESYYGTLADLAIYPTALTSATIAAHYHAANAADVPRSSR